MSNQAIQSRGHLYRYVSFERAVDIFENKRLFFARPSSWQDPYEVQLVHRGSDMLFAQCWCQTAVSDAMWRLYCPDEKGVRIGTTKQKLVAELTRWTAQRGLGLRHDEVRYEPAADLRALTRSLAKRLRADFDLRQAAGALLLKREAYAHENEWRAVIYGDAPEAGDAGLRVQIDPARVITSVLLDPRAPEEWVAESARFFAEELGFKKPVKASALAKPPDPIVVD